MPHTKRGYHRKAWVYSDGSIDVVIGYKDRERKFPELIRYDDRSEFIKDWED
jgi:hypothetical protein